MKTFIISALREQIVEVKVKAESEEEVRALIDELSETINCEDLKNKVLSLEVLETLPELYHCEIYEEKDN